jgi:putative hemolysin
MNEIQKTEIQYIDIDKILEKRNPKLKKWLPAFMIRYIKKIAHQEEINAYLDKHGSKIGRPFLEGVFEEFNIQTEIIGIENLPKNNKLIFAANHPLGGIDGAAFIYEIGKFYPNIKTIINDLLLNVKNMEGIFVGVNSFGKNTREHLLGIEKMFNSDAQILMFPSGFVSRRQKGIIMDLEWKKTFIDWSRKYQRDIIPVHFSGRISNFFYNFANLRKFFGVKANLEMFYLVNEMFKHRGGKLTITIGKPIPYTTFLNPNIKPTEWADYIRAHVYKLAQNPKESFSIN